MGTGKSENPHNEWWLTISIVSYLPILEVQWLMPKRQRFLSQNHRTNSLNGHVFTIGKSVKDEKGPFCKFGQTIFTQGSWQKFSNFLTFWRAKISHRSPMTNCARITQACFLFLDKGKTCHQAIFFSWRICKISEWWKRPILQSRRLHPFTCSF